MCIEKKLIRYHLSVTQIAGQTETRPINKTNVGANLMFALQTITGIKPMLGNAWVLLIGLVSV